MTFEATQDFANWATGFAGCDGGNKLGSIWLCGIEWGAKKTDQDVDYSSEFSKDVRFPPEGFTKKSDNDYGFNRRFLKLLAAMQSDPTKDHLYLYNSEPIPFHKDSDLFKINVYPIAFNRDSDELWGERLWRATGLPTKSLYRAWCQKYRFPVMKSWIEKYSPKLIIATGWTYRSDYKLAFGGIEAIYGNATTNIDIVLDDKKLEFLEINGGKTILAIIPFLGGTNGLNSDKRIGAYGRALKIIWENKFGIWP